MRRIGQLLMLLGLGVGLVVGLAMIMGITVSGVPLLVAIGLGKLTLFASGGLMAGGATLQRIAARHERRDALPAQASPPGVNTPV